MSERDEAIALANRLLDQPYSDPDDDLRVLARQLLHRQETIDKLVPIIQRAAQHIESISPRPGPYHQDFVALLELADLFSASKRKP